MVHSNDPQNSEVDAYTYIKEELEHLGWVVKNPARFQEGEVYKQNEVLSNIELKECLGLDRPEAVVRLNECEYWVIESVDTKSLRHWDAFSYFSVARSVLGFVTPTLEWARAMKQVIGDKTVLEVGAGTGLVAKYLHEAGVNIISTDDYSWHKKDSFHWKSYYPVENLDFRDAIRKYKADFLLTCWAMYESPMAMEAAELFTELNPEGNILYIGEGSGGCTASDDFFNGIEVLDYLEDVNTVYPQWFGLHDECWLVKWIGINENESSE